MPVFLITGTPGAGKTLFMVQRLVEELIPTGRLIFHNINGLNIDSPNLFAMDEDGAKHWHKTPENSVIVIDECQRVFPPRNPMSGVPAYVSAFETHRHRGLDIYLVTQGPSLIDAHIKPLIGQHTHVYRPYGLKRSTILTWEAVNPTPAPRQSALNAQKRNFNFPKKYYALYKSATQHTVQPRFPWRFVVIIAAIAGVLVWGAVRVIGDVRRMATPPDLVIEGVQDEPQPQRDCYTLVGLTSSRALLRDQRSQLVSFQPAQFQSLHRLQNEQGVTWCNGA